MRGVWRVLAAALALLLVASASVGVWVYLSHTAPARGLAGVSDYSDLLSRVSRLSYTLSYGGSEYRVQVECESSCLKGAIRVHGANGNQLYVIEFEYIGGLFTARKVYANGTTLDLDPTVYTSGIIGNLVFKKNAEGAIVGVEVFPGLAPLLLPYHLGVVYNVDWSLVARLEGGGTLPSTSLVETSVGGERYRGLSLVFLGHGVYVGGYEWRAPTFELILVSLDGIPVASTIVAVVPDPLTGEAVEVRVTLESLKRA
ncbi:MAG: hypothetical protein QXS85_03850 [Acidilobaceae archaeon]